jgi:ribosomal protein S21
MQVKVKNGNIDGALRLFKKKCSDKLFTLKEKQYYEKPSTKRQAKHKSAVKREEKRKK